MFAAQPVPAVAPSDLNLNVKQPLGLFQLAETKRPLGLVILLYAPINPADVLDPS